MPDYRVAGVDGVKYRRCHRIIIENPYMQAPGIAFSEQDVLTIGDGTPPIKIPVGDLSTLLGADNLFEEFEVLDMEGNPSGIIMNFLQFYGIVNGLYRHFAAKRDAAAEAAAAAAIAAAEAAAAQAILDAAAASSSSIAAAEAAAAAAASSSSIAAAEAAAAAAASSSIAAAEAEAAAAAGHTVSSTSSS